MIFNVLGLPTVKRQKAQSDNTLVICRYKKNLLDALLMCKTECKKNDDSEYIRRYGIFLMGQMANNVKDIYTYETYVTDHDKFLDFYTQIILKIQPSVRENLLEKLDDVNDAFNSMHTYKQKEKMRKR
jgi:hypothetical protein